MIVVGLACRNCGAFLDRAVTTDDRGMPVAEPCPKPTPGRPFVDCGIGGHMFNVEKPYPQGVTP